MKSGWDRYAPEKRYVKKGYLRKYCNRSTGWQTPETGSSNSAEQSRKEEKVNPELSLDLQENIQWYGKTVLLTGEVDEHRRFYENEADRQEVSPSSSKESTAITKDGQNSGKRKAKRRKKSEVI